MTPRILSALYVLSVLLVCGGLLYELITGGTPSKVGYVYGTIGFVYAMCTVTVDAAKGFPTTEAALRRLREKPIKSPRY